MVLPIASTLLGLILLAQGLGPANVPPRKSCPDEGSQRLELRLVGLEAIRSRFAPSEPLRVTPFVESGPIELTLDPFPRPMPTLAPVIHEPRTDARPSTDAPIGTDVPFALGVPPLREPPTLELLHELSFSIRPSSVGLTLATALPIGGKVEQGQYLRDDDVNKSAIKIDKHFVATWVFDARFKVEAGYSVTYLSAEGGTSTYLRQGPWGGLSFEF